MEWYLVIKTIHGHQYYYKQKTYRVGKRVRTQNIYVGPVRNGRPNMPVKGGWSSGHPELSGAITLPIPFPTKSVEVPASVIEGAFAAVMEHVEGEGWDQGWELNVEKVRRGIPARRSFV